MTSTHDIDALIVKTAAALGGLVPTQILRDAGHTWRPIKLRVASGLLVPVCRGVVRLATTPATPLLNAAAGAFISPGSWISHHTALVAFGIDVAEDRRTGCGVAPGHMSNVRRIRIPGIIGHERNQPTPGDLSRWKGIPISRPWLAIVESAATLSVRDLTVALDRVIHEGLASPRRVERCLTANPKVHGSPLLRDLLLERLGGEGIVRSFFEHDLNQVLRRNGIVGAVRNHRVSLRNGRYRVLDAAFPHLRVALEADSWRHHSSARDWGQTRIRDRELAAEGWLVVPVVFADTKGPDELVAHLREIIRQKTAQKGGFVTDRASG